MQICIRFILCPAFFQKEVKYLLPKLENCFSRLGITQEVCELREHVQITAVSTLIVCVWGNAGPSEGGAQCEPLLLGLKGVVNPWVDMPGFHTHPGSSYRKNDLTSLETHLLSSAGNPAPQKGEVGILLLLEGVMTWIEENDKLNDVFTEKIMVMKGPL